MNKSDETPNNMDPLVFLGELIARYPSLAVCRESILAAYEALTECYEKGGKLLIAGNGGSAADSEHIVGELMKGFKKNRVINPKLQSIIQRISPDMADELIHNLQEGLPAIALDGHPALTTAFSNDKSPLLCFAQQINGYGREGDIFLGITTSGNSKNILYAAVTAKAKGLKVIGLTGAKDSKLSTMADITIKAPETETFMVQELHLPIYHCLCLMLEERFF